MHIFDGATGGRGQSNVSGPHAQFLDTFQSVEVQLTERRTNPDAEFAVPARSVTQVSALETGSASEDFISVFSQMQKSLEELRLSEKEQRKRQLGLDPKMKCKEQRQAAM